MNQNSVKHFLKRNSTRILACIGLAIIAFLLLILGRLINNECKDIANQFIFPLSCSLFALIPTYFAIDSVGKNWIKLKERVDHGLRSKTILLAGDKEECDNVEAQLHHSQLLNKDNVTNQSMNIKSDEQEYNYNCAQFTNYDLVILCFNDKSLKSVTPSYGGKQDVLNDKQTALLQHTLESIGDSETTKQALKSQQDITGLITLCPQRSLCPDIPIQNEPFQRPFTVVVNQIGRMMTDIFSLLTILPPRNGE